MSFTRENYLQIQIGTLDIVQYALCSRQREHNHGSQAAVYLGQKACRGNRVVECWKCCECKLSVSIVIDNEVCERTILDVSVFG